MIAIFVVAMLTVPATARSWDELVNRGADAGHSLAVTTTDTSQPVELASLTARADNDGVVISWVTLSETDNDGFEVEAAHGNGEFAKIGNVPGAGTTTDRQVYSFRVPTAYGLNQFRLRQINDDGSAIYSEVVEARASVSGAHVISRMYPNPFSDQATMTLSVPEGQEVRVELYSVLGQRVATLFGGYVATNSTEKIVLDGGHLPAGFYVVKVTGERFKDAQVVTLVR